MKIGIIKEGKTPTDHRVPLTPIQCRFVLDHFPIDLKVEPSNVRCFSDFSYLAESINVQPDLSDCDVLLGIKEVPFELLIPNKTYFFFSHTIKKQPYNRHLLQEVLHKKIKLIDYEALKYTNEQRVVAFGYFAGIVGAHNAIWTYGQRTKAFQLKRLKDHPDYATAKRHYSKLQLPPLKIVITGTGRVGQGASKTLSDMGIQQVSPKAFLTQAFAFPVFTKLTPKYYVARKDERPTDKFDFYKNPQLYKSHFYAFTQVSDILINGIYWANGAPAFFTTQEMRSKNFKIKVIADISCDLFPDGAIPSTIRATTIQNPVYGYNPATALEEAPFQDHLIDVMTIDNLPSEVPTDASTNFGEQLIKNVLPELLKPQSDMLDKATIAVNGKLGPHFTYLNDFVKQPA